MAGAISVEAEWALHGKRLDRQGYRVLARSTGELSAQNFEEAIGRFSPGTPGELPQVTVSYLQDATRPGGSYYLALTTHHYADQLYGDDDQQLKYDDDGRRIMITSYLCVPYDRLATGSVSYQSMYRALDRNPLPLEDGPPLPITMAAPGPSAPLVDDLPLAAAALLLTGRPVCVLVGAEQTSMDERLQFIDAVMALLPYGLRSRMAAATWTRPTNRDHRFRLFFSDVPRSVEPPDHVLHWGRPETAPRLNKDFGYAHEYQKWLADKVSQPTAELARLPNPLRFDRDQILRMLDEIGVASEDPSRNYSAIGQDLLHAAFPSRAGTSNGRGRAERILRDCAMHVRAADQRLIRSDIVALKNMARGKFRDEDRARFREIISETGLLQHSEELGGDAGKLYKDLLKVAFTAPFSYEGYCQVEDCLAALPPYPTLLQAIDGARIADTRVSAIVYWHLRDADPKKLSNWYKRHADHFELIDLLAAVWSRPQHAQAVCEVTLRYLHETHPDSQQIRVRLRQHGFLAEALRSNAVGHEQYQVNALYRFLQAAYPNALDPASIRQILTGKNGPPTPSLLAAVLLRLRALPDERRTACAELAGELFVQSSITQAGFTRPRQDLLAGRIREIATDRDRQ